VTERDVVVDANALRAFVARMFESAAMPIDDARFCARSLVQANLWGFDSHGVLRLPLYLRRLRSGGVNPRPAIRKVRGDAAFEVLDGDAGMGFLVARNAMIRAIELAERFGLGGVCAVNSNHFGAAGLYTRVAAERGLVGIAMSNSVAKVVAPGGSSAITGSNPLSVAIPTYGAFPFVLDMSLSAAAGGRLLQASRRGERIPLGWATDRHGRPTDDPDEAFAGFYMPSGGVKGLGLSYVIDILCGVVAGGPFGPMLTSMFQEGTPGRTGHMMIAMDISAIISPELMRERMGDFVAAVKASPMLDESGEMIVPGEIAHRTETRRAAGGIPLPLSLYEELVALGGGLSPEARPEGNVASEG
jgi:L-2-hydroxycarboxylate dehydrogenase (NAD+)